MKFQRLPADPSGESLAEISDCGRYTVCGARVEGAMTFQGWRRSLLDIRPATLLTRRRVVTKTTARGHCMADAAAKQLIGEAYAPSV